jgi:hypothetical protein
MYKTSFAILLGSLFLSTAALAAADFSAVDANGDGKATWQEVSAAAPEISEDRFKVADADGDGALTPEEYAKLTTQ